MANRTSRNPASGDCYDGDGDGDGGGGRQHWVERARRDRGYPVGGKRSIPWAASVLLEDCAVGTKMEGEGWSMK